MQVKTTSGYVQGYRRDGIYHFQGIPYATAKRFMPPEKYRWEGVYNASRFGRKAVQSCPMSAENDRLTYSEEYGENCLNLDIYVPGDAPEKKGKMKLPVAVYIHGGAFQNGSSRDRGGPGMIRDHRFIYVSVNYRLGVLGYLYLGKALGERYQHTGNNGTLDQLAALGWIRENIEAFGGDTSRITVFGESAGAKSLGALLLKPEMKTFCSQVMMASGAYQCIRDENTAAAVADVFFELAGMERPEDILDMDVDNLIQMQERLVDNPGNTCMFGPVADGTVIPYDWEEILKSPSYWSGNAIIGCCRHEMIFRRLEDPDFVSHAPEVSGALFGRNAVIVREEFADYVKERESRGENLTEGQKGEKWEQLLSDYMYRTYSCRLARILNRNGSRVWYYSMDFGTAAHVLDQAAAFDGAWKEERLFPGIPMEERRKMAEIIYETYIRFLETGDPNGEGIPVWKPLCESSEKMVWDAPIHTEPLTEAEAYDRFPESVYRLADRGREGRAAIMEPEQ